MQYFLSGKLKEKFDLNVQFITTNSSKLSSLPITNGQIIALNDVPGYYYDMNDSRNHVSGTEIVSSLPTSGESNILYVCTDSEELYRWNGTEFIKLLESPSDNQSYVRKNGKWSKLNYIYECTSGSVSDPTNIRNIVQTFNSSSANTLYLKIEGTLSIVSSNTPYLNFTVASGKNLYLDFSNCYVSFLGHNCNIFLFLNGSGTAYVIGLNNPIATVGISASTKVCLQNCQFGSNSVMSTAVSSSGELIISNSTFDLTELTCAISLSSTQPVANIHDCNFIPHVSDNAGKAIKLTSSTDKSKVSVYNNQIPADGFQTKNATVDVSFTNICT